MSRSKTGIVAGSFVGLQPLLAVWDAGTLTGAVDSVVTSWTSSVSSDALSNDVSSTTAATLVTRNGRMAVRSPYNHAFITGRKYDGPENLVYGRGPI